ncbi:MAG: tyrosine-type recombinase/integrase [Anaerovoracaceae bacterium]
MPAYKDDKGKWYCKFYYQDWTGERKQKKKSGFKTQREAKEWEREFLRAKNSAQITVSDLCDSYMKHKTPELKPKSIETYTTTIEKNIKPYIGKIKADELSPLMVKEWHTQLNSSISIPNINYSHTILSAVYNYGVKLYGINRNPCTAAGKLKTQKKEMRIITKEEFNSILPYLSDTYKVMFSILFWAGLRLGECLALTADDIKDKSITVNKNIVKVKGVQIAQDTPKTSNSRRTVEIHDKLYDMILDYIDRLYDKEGRIFPMSDTAARYAFSKACDKAGLGHVRIHDLRHSHVSMLIHMGYYPKAIAERIGDTVNTMMNVYSHIYKDDRRKMADEIGMIDN